MGTLKAINVMYEQQLCYLPSSIKTKTLNAIFNFFIKRLTPLKIACIIHDADIDKNGLLVAPHVHIVLQFKNQRSLRNLAKLINEPQASAFEQWKGNINNAYSYLVHQTSNASQKF